MQREKHQMLNLGVSISLKCGDARCRARGLTADSSGNGRATGMVMFYMSAIIDLLQIETEQKCLVTQYRRHPMGWRYYFPTVHATRG